MEKVKSKQKNIFLTLLLFIFCLTLFSACGSVGGTEVGNPNVPSGSPGENPSEPSPGVTPPPAEEESSIKIKESNESEEMDEVHSQTLELEAEDTDKETNKDTNNEDLNTEEDLQNLE